MWEWLKDLLLWVPRRVWSGILDAVATVLEAIPVPDWLQEVDLWGALPDTVAYFLAAFQVFEGLTIIIGAYGIRFLIRRLPIVG